MILCLSHTQDFYTIDIVQQQLAALGNDVYRLNSDLFSHRLQFDYGQGTDGHFEFLLKTGDRTFCSTDVTAVWYRKLWHITPPPELDNAYHRIFHQEYDTMRDIFFDALAQVPWMNNMPRDHHIAGNKALQLQLAAKNGLEVPRSLFTNHPERLRDFFHTVCNRQMIAKLHGTLSRSMSGSGAFLPTTQVQEDDLQRLETLPYCPMIFQELVPKQYELRVIYVAGQIFAGQIDTRASAQGQTDWRAANDIKAAWAAYTLPDEVCTCIDNMMQEMGLLFGALDIIRHTDGRYIFLEVNPQGEWGMLQRDLGYPIGETIAAELAARITTKNKNAARLTI
jgi:glutathione synthase/RimK-type ligase-like ATP-grasp enzyme